MYLTHLLIHQIRVISDADLSFNPSVNFIIGPNGSGKTSLLEGLSILSSGQSFRSRQINDIISDTASMCRIVGKLSSHDQSKHSLIGIERFKDGKVNAKKDGEPLKQLSGLSDSLPLRVFHPESTKSVLGSGSDRRRYLDWLVFHVEHQYRHHWSTYKRTLSQRNALLKKYPVSREQVEIWDQQLVSHGLAIDMARKLTMEKLRDEINVSLSLLDADFEVEMNYLQGWQKEISFDQALQSSFERCMKYGTTSVGPHKADIVFKSKKTDVKRIFSRGQIKIFSYSLLLAQIRLLKQITGHTPVIAIDDLTAELDTKRVDSLFQYLVDNSHQVFITGTDRENFSTFESSKTSMFHVEHGNALQVL